MFLPNYKNGSIVNLTSSILKAFNVKSNYAPLKELDDLDNTQNIVLLVIDGLGYEYLKKHGANSVFEKYLVKKLTSVFPAGTPSAETTLRTGATPEKHGIMGWYMYLKELGVVSVILPFVARCGGSSFSNYGVGKKEIFTEKTINEKINNPSYMVYPDEISDGNKISGKEKYFLTFNSLRGLFTQIKKATKDSNKKKYIYAYWSQLDAICHRRGVKSKEAKKHFEELNQKIASFMELMRGTNTTLIITADHGLIDTPKEKVIFLEDHPKLYETLTLPLCGQARVAYCYVHPAKVKQFEKYVKEKLNYCCELYKSEDLIKRGFFGLFKPSEKLFDRIGDYALIMKENYIIKDKLLKEKIDVFIGNHGGVSKEEMFVPLVVIKI